MKNSLIGKCVLVDQGESYRTGKITEMVGPALFLVAFDLMNDRDSTTKINELVCVDEMLGTSETTGKTWQFFTSRAKLDAWIGYIDGPAKGADVLKLVKS